MDTVSPSKKASGKGMVWLIAFIVTLLCILPVFWLRRVTKGKIKKQ